MRMKFIKNTGPEKLSIDLPNGSSVRLAPGAKLENVDVDEVPDNCESLVELSEIKRSTGKTLLHD